MKQFRLSLPDDLGDWATARAAEARMGGADEYLADLVRRDRDDFERSVRETERLRVAWAEGLASGEPQSVPADWADQVIARGRARLAAARGDR